MSVCASPSFELPRVDERSSIPRYLQVKAILSEGIRTGRFPPGSQLPNTAEIGEQLNVSLLTAHRAIRALAREGWVRREVGRGTFVRPDFEAVLAARPRFRVALVFSTETSLADFYHGELMAGIQRAAEAAERPGESIIHRLRHQRDLGVLDADGYICFHPCREEFRQLERLAAGRPVVVLGASYAGTPLCCVDSENFVGARMAVRHLIHLGHRRIAIINGRLAASNAHDRFEGYRAELESAGLAVREEHVFNANQARSAASVIGRLATVLHDSQRPTAILACGYNLALEAMTLLRRIGLHVPRDVSLIGFDDTKSAALLDPPLTTVRQPLEEMGIRAYEQVVQLLQGLDPSPRVGRLPTSLMLRESTAPVSE